MSDRADAVAAFLEDALPGMKVRCSSYAEALDAPEVFDGPVLTVADGLARGFLIVIFGDEEDDLDALCAAAFEALPKEGILLSDQDDFRTRLHLCFTTREPVLDSADFLIGEAMQFVTIEEGSSAVAAE